MKLVFAWLVACSAIAEHDFSDDALTLLQVRSTATSHSEQPDSALTESLDSLQESEVAESEATEATELAQQALTEALAAEAEADEAEDSWDTTETEGALLQKPKGRKPNGNCKKGPKGNKCRKVKKAKAQADAAAKDANTAMSEATDAESKADEAAQKADMELAEQTDAVAAVGDPHMTLNTGDNNDLCCKGSVCKPCSVALSQKPKGKKPNGKCKKGPKGKKCRKAKKAKQDAQDAIDLAEKATTEAQTAQSKAAEAELVVGETDTDETGNVDGASAVGDPHLSSDKGQKQDLCCKGGVCKPCLS